MAAMSENDFIGYEYRDVTVRHEMEPLYVDSYKNFGWTLDNSNGYSNVSMKFKRDRKIRNKAELTRLQHQFDACVKDIMAMEDSKTRNASVTAFTAGIIGTAFLAGATFSYLYGMIILCIVLAIPGFIGWILPYFLYKSTYAKQSAKVTPFIDSKYDEVYEVCERASRLLCN